MVGVGVNTVQYWESGTTYPKAETLKKLLEIYLRYGLFTTGKELKEAHEMWEKVRQEAPRLNAGFDRAWFQELIDRTAKSRYPGQESPSLVTTPLHNLPARLSSFIGRKKELALLDLRLGRTPGASSNATLPQTASRLITLSGEGGSGKTSLALHAAREKLTDYPHGVWLVELAPLTLEPELTQALAGAVGVQAQGRRPLLDQTVDYLREKKLLLVLDNCEHLIEESARVVTTLLEECPNLQILATSRERLKVKGEFILRVPSLSLPEAKSLFNPNAPDGPDEQAALNELLSYEAVALFVERAGNANPRFKLSRQNHKTVVEICRRLDGIPLALELAAARLRVLSATELAERLQDRFRLLSSSSDRTVSPRHRTLQAAVDWSYALLNPPEKELFRRLSVFANGWDLPAAEEICGFGELRAADILDLLQELVDKSLVVVEEISIPNSGRESDPEVKLRFKLLQTLRDYGRERLAELSSAQPGVSEWGSEAQTLQARHLLYFSAFATRHIPESGWGQTYLERKTAYQQIETEQFNLIEALNRVTSSSPTSDGPLVKAALEMAVPLACLWNEKNSYQESVYHLTSLKKKAQEAGLDHSVPFGRAADWLGLAVFYTGDPAQAALFFQESFEIFTASDDKRGKMRSLLHLGTVATIQGDFTKALEYFSASLDLAYGLGEKEDTVNALRNLGTVYGNLGEFKKAREYFENGLKLARENGDPLTLAGLLVHTAPIVTMTGDYELAQNYLLESLPLLRANNKKVLLSSSLGNLGFIADYLDDFEAAYSYFQRALTIQKEIGFTTNIAISLHNLANLSLRVGNYDEAVNFHTESKIYFQRAPGQVSSALLAFTESSLAEYQGKFDLAIQKKREALAIFWETKELHYTLNLLKDLAWLMYRKHTAANTGEIPGSSPVSQPILGKIIWVLGAAANLLKEIDEKFKPAEQQDVDKMVEGCRQVVGVEVYERFFNEGAATPLPEVLDRVLSPAFND